jgi:hypothetical protein
MKSLAFLSVIGILFYFFGTPYSPFYSILLLLWSTIFVEYWRVCERKIAVRWGSRGAFRVEKRRYEFNQEDLSGEWWKNELQRFLRITASVPVIFVFVLMLTAILTGLFVFEAFVTQLYHGPGQQYIASRFISLSPLSDWLSVTGADGAFHGRGPQFHGILSICEFRSRYFILYSLNPFRFSML